MELDEIQTLDTVLASEAEEELTDADIKRRKLEEDMRKEAAERKKKRDELLKKEEEYEKVNFTRKFYISMRIPTHNNLGTLKSLVVGNP